MSPAKLTPAQVAQLSDEEIQRMIEEAEKVRIARENLLKYGSVLGPDQTAVAPTTARAAVESDKPRAPRRRKGAADEAKAIEAPEPDWSKVIQTCPRCSDRGSVEEKFGTTVVRGVRRGQSWCRSCRAGANYHSKPRKYQTKRGGPRH